MIALLAANMFFDPLVNALGGVLTAIHSVIPSYGWALIALALLVSCAWRTPITYQPAATSANMRVTARAARTGPQSVARSG